MKLKYTVIALVAFVLSIGNMFAESAPRYPDATYVASEFPKFPDAWSNVVSKTALTLEEEIRQDTDKFRQAFFDSLPDIAEKPGNHRKWNEVTPTDHGRWAWLNLPSDSKQKVKDDEN